MRIAPALLALALAFPGAAAAKGGASCTAPVRQRDYARFADLPDQVRTLFRFPMAERGQPFQATDVLMPGPRLPSTRFVAARETGCSLRLDYQQGGIALFRATALFERRGGRWLMLRRR